MSTRLQAALEFLTMYVPPVLEPDVPDAQEADVDLTPDGSMSETSDSDYDSLATPLSDTPVPSAPSVPLNLGPIAPADLRALYEQLNPHGRRRSYMAAEWERAEQLNHCAFLDWKSTQVNMPRLLSSARTVEAAGNATCRSAAWAVKVFRCLPYPEVALALLPTAAMRRLGQELIVLGREWMLDALRQASQSELHRQSLADWIRTITDSSVSHDERWERSHDEATWQLHARALDRPDIMSQRSFPESDENAWYRLVAVLTILTPSTSTIDAQSHRVQEWMSAFSSHARDTIQELRMHNWFTLRQVVAESLTSLSVTPAAPILALLGTR
jgi:hypothetical protein